MRGKQGNKCRRRLCPVKKFTRRRSANLHDLNPVPRTLVIRILVLGSHFSIAERDSILVNGRWLCAGSSLPLGGARYPCVCESCVCAHVPAATTRHLRDCGQLRGLAIFVAPTMVGLAVPAPNPTSHARPRRPGLADFGPRASDQLD
jgi:hypothetical protein